MGFFPQKKWLNCRRWKFLSIEELICAVLWDLPYQEALIRLSAGMAENWYLQNLFTGNLKSQQAQLQNRWKQIFTADRISSDSPQQKRSMFSSSPKPLLRPHQQLLLLLGLFLPCLLAFGPLESCYDTFRCTQVAGSDNKKIVRKV